MHAEGSRWQAPSTANGGLRSRALFESGIGADPLIEVRSTLNVARRLGEDTIIVLSRFTDVRVGDGRVDATEFVATFAQLDGEWVFRAVVQMRDERLPFSSVEEGRVGHALPAAAGGSAGAAARSVPRAGGRLRAAILRVDPGTASRGVVCVPAMGDACGCACSARA